MIFQLYNNSSKFSEWTIVLRNRDSNPTTQTNPIWQGVQELKFIRLQFIALLNKLVITFLCFFIKIQIQSTQSKRCVQTPEQIVRGSWFLDQCIALTLISEIFALDGQFRFLTNTFRVNNAKIRTHTIFKQN